MKYYLQTSPLSSKPDGHIARVDTEQNLDTDGFIKEMLQSGTTLTEPDLRAALTLMNQVLCHKLSAGSSVQLPFGRLSPSIRGVFTSSADQFDKARHKLKVNFTATPSLQEAIETADMEKVQQHLSPAPIVWTFFDKRSKASTKFSPGGVAEILGEELKFNPANELEGVYFLHEDGTTRTKITEVHLIKDKKLLFTIPADLKTGKYTLEVHKAYGKTNAIRVGKLKKALTNNNG